MSSPILVLAALLAGLAAGFAVGHPVPALGIVATLWVNALRMTVLPLVTALIVTSTASLRPAESGRSLSRALILFVTLLAGAAAITVVIASTAFARLEIPPTERDALRAQWSAPGTAPTLSAWLATVIPANPVAAAAEGNLLGVIVFALALGLALATLPAEKAQPVLVFFDGLGAAMQVILRWVLYGAPVAVFALALQVSATSRAAAGALGYYLLTLLASILLALAGVYIWIAIQRPVPLVAFARAAWPAQLVACSTRSSLAALPLLVEATARLRLDAARAGLILPLAMSLLRLSAPASQLTAVIFSAKLCGIPLEPGSLVLAAAIAVMLSFSVTGIPNASFLVMMPLFTTLGIPVEAIGLLLAVDLIPDVAKTATNVTAHLAAVCLLSASPSPATPAPGGAPADPAVPRHRYDSEIQSPDK